MDGQTANLHRCTPDQVLAHFKSDGEAGLSADAAAAKLLKHGPNELAPEQSTPFLTLVLRQFDDLLVKILLAAAAVDLVITLLNGESGISAFVEPFVILLILAANAVVGVTTESNAEAAIASLRALEAATATVIRGGQAGTIPMRDVVPGDLVVLRAGQQVPADCYVLEIQGGSLQIDQSILTGESGSVGKVAGAVDAPPAAVAQDKHNMVFSGSMVQAGRANCIAVATGEATAVGRIKDALAASVAAATPLKQKLDEFGALLSKLIAGICVLVWVINIGHFGTAGHGSWLQGAIYYFKIAVALAVAAIPEGLPAVVTTCLALGSKRLAAKNAIVRTLPSVETLGCTTVICVDKTGTLTSNAMSVLRAAVPTSEGLAAYRVHGHADSSARRIHPCTGPGGARQQASDSPLRDPSELQGLLYLALCASLCTDSALAWDASSGAANHVGESTEVAMQLFAETVGLPGGRAAGCAEASEQERGGCSAHWRSMYPRLSTLEFDRQRKLMSVCCSTSGAPGGGDSGDQTLIFSKGAPEELLRRCSFAIDESGQASTAMTQELQQRWTELLNDWSGREALRCIALAYSALPDRRAELTVEDESNLVFLGILGLQDPPRPEAAPAVQRCLGAGIRVLMLTGDNIATAEAVAREVGIMGSDVAVTDDSFGGGGGAGTHRQSMTATEFDALDEEAQRRAVTDLRVLARVEPQHKQRLVELLQAEDEVVAMTGDGVNDAPALRWADIGVAMGSGTAVARHASDMVLTDDNFATIVAAVAEGRTIFANTKQFIRYMVSSNVGEVVAIVAAAAVGLPAPLSPVQLLWVNLVTDGLPATALSFNKADGDVMRAPPRRPSTGIVGRWLLARYLLIGAYVGVVTVTAFAWWFLRAPAGPRMTWAALARSQACDDATRTHAFACAVFADLRPSTMAMSVLVVVEMFNALNALSENRSLAAVPPWRNPLLLAAIAISMALHFAILYTPWLAAIFGVTALSWDEWRMIVVLSAPVVAADEVLKSVSRQLERPEGMRSYLSSLVPRGLGKYALLAGDAVREKARKR